MSLLRDPRRLVALALAVGGVASLVMAVGVVVMSADAPLGQQVGAALVPSLVGVAALVASRRWWRRAAAPGVSGNG